MGQFNGNEPLKELISRQPDFAELALTQLSSELVSIKLRDRPINGVRKETIEAMDDGLIGRHRGMFLQQYISVVSEPVRSTCATSAEHPINANPAGKT